MSPKPLQSISRTALAVALAPALLAGLSSFTPARAQVRAAPGPQPIAGPLPGLTTPKPPYTVSDLGPISGAAPVGCTNDLTFYGTRDKGGEERAFVGSNPNAREDLYYDTLYTTMSEVDGCSKSTYLAVGVEDDHAVVWDFNWTHIQYLPGTSGAFPVSAANGVNSLRQVVGTIDSYFSGPDTAIDAVLWNTSTAPDNATATLVFLQQYAWANAINNGGVIVGATYAFPDENATTARLWANDGNHTGSDLIPGSRSEAFDVNNSNVAAGRMWDATTGVWRGFIVLPKYAPKTLAPVTLPDPVNYTSSEARALNDAGMVVGRTWSPNESRATLWFKGTAYDLNTLIGRGTPQLTAASSISTNGNIVCGGTGTDGQPHAYLLTPTGSALP